MYIVLLLLLISSYIDIINGDICSTNGLTSPRTIQWTKSPSSATTFTATLTFSQATKTYNNNAISLTTRVFNNQLPGPTLVIQRGNTYKITLVNNLPANPAGNDLLSGNIERDVNTVNLHTHGLHISGAPGGDEVLTPIEPVGGSKTYTYNIPCTHSGGIHWYHSHHHPSVQVHVGGGAAGVIIVEDDKNIEGLPDWYTGMRELIFWITHLSATFINSNNADRLNSGESILSLTPNNDVFLVNGEYQPTVCMKANEWIKFRFGQTEIWNPQRYSVGNTGDCTLKLLARDGVIVNGVPRTVGNIVWLAESSRADVAITCGTAGTYPITALDGDADARNGAQPFIVAYIEVYSGTTTTTATTLTSFTPNRPSYLTDLRSATVDNTLSLDIRPDGIVVNGGPPQRFGIQANPYFSGVSSLTIDSVNEWTIIKDSGGCCGGPFHPFHIHINHFQVMTDVGNETPSTDQPQIIDAGYQQVGDWLDTYWGPGVIRFKPDIWGGPLVLHCHKLDHEVRGAMGAVWVSDGCDYDYTGYNGATCGFDWNSCTSAATSNPTKSPLILPTVNPTKSPSASPIVVHCMADEELDCTQNADCCDNWCDFAGANPKCKIPNGGRPPRGRAVSVGDGDETGNSFTSDINGKTINGLYVIVVIVVVVLLIGLSIIGYICCRKKSRSKIEIRQEIEISVETMEKQSNESELILVHDEGTNTSKY